MHVNVWLSSFAVHLKLSQHCVVLVYSVLYSVFFFLWPVLAARVIFAARGLSLVWRVGGFSSGSVQAQQLCRMGSGDLRLVEPSWTRDQTHIPCTGRQILNHWTTWEVLSQHC